MKHEGINSTRLAEILGIQASGISHIMSGRNKPSYDFLLKLLQRFPQINPDWLILDKGPMYRDEIKKGAWQSAPSIASDPSQTMPYAATSAVQQKPNAGLFSESAAVSNPVAAPLATAFGRDDEDIIPSNNASNPVQQPARGFMPSSSIERIVVFYKDKTFSEYQPE